MKKIISAILLLNKFILLYSQSLEVPAITNPDFVIAKDFYILQCNEQFEQADWIAYELGFIQSSEKGQRDLESYAVSVDAVVYFTGERLIQQ